MEIEPVGFLLKKCPFCGGYGRLLNLDRVAYKDVPWSEFAVKCDDCGYYLRRESSRKVIDAWNLRADCKNEIQGEALKKRCPFCGRHGKVKTIRGPLESDYAPPVYGVTCDACGYEMQRCSLASTVEAWDTRNEDCERMEEKEKMPKLYLCPFCFGYAEVRNVSKGALLEHIACCHKCGATIKGSGARDVALAWNRRHG